MSQQHFAIGNAQIVTPDGWTSVSQTDEKLVLCSSRQQQATISVMHFDNDATFEQFKTLCDIRIKGEMQFAPDGFVERETPFKDQTGFGMFFYGGTRRAGVSSSAICLWCNANSSPSTSKESASTHRPTAATFGLL
jgi:hypothetical protein